MHHSPKGESICPELGDILPRYIFYSSWTRMTQLE